MTGSTHGHLSIHLPSTLSHSLHPSFICLFYSVVIHPWIQTQLPHCLICKYIKLPVARMYDAMLFRFKRPWSHEHSPIEGPMNDMAIWSLAARSVDGGVPYTHGLTYEGRTKRQEIHYPSTIYPTCTCRGHLLSFPRRFA